MRRLRKTFGPALCYACHSCFECCCSLSVARQTAESPTNLKVGYLSIAAGHSVLWVTKGAGLFAKRTECGNHLCTFVRSDSSHAVPGNYRVSRDRCRLSRRSQRRDFVVLGTLRKTPTLVYLASHKKITSVQQLRGKKLGVGRFGSATDKVLVMTLKKVGIEPNEVTLLQLG